MGEPNGEIFFGVNHFGLRFSGIMSPANEGRISKFIFLIHSRIIMSLMFYYLVVAWMGITDSYKDKYELSKCLLIALTHTVGVGKELFVLLNIQKFKRIMANLAGGEFIYEKCQEKGFHPKSVFNKHKKSGRIFTISFFILCFISVTTGFVPQLYYGLVSARRRNGPTDANFTMPKLPYFIWTPFEITTFEKYSLAVIYQCIPSVYHVFGIVAVDTLCVNIMNCVAMNLTLIEKAYFTLRERCCKKVADSRTFRDSPELRRELKLEMRKICQHLQSIYKICNDLEDMNKYLYLLQTGGSMFGICSSLYVAVDTPLGDARIISEFGYLLGLITQLLLFCWFGNEVKLKAANIPLCIWESDWISMDTSLKKELILTMARTNVPLVLTAGSYIPLDLETFMQVLKGSYSFYTFMKSLK